MPSDTSQSTQTSTSGGPDPVIICIAPPNKNLRLTLTQIVLDLWEPDEEHDLSLDSKATLFYKLKRTMDGQPLTREVYDNVRLDGIWWSKVDNKVVKGKVNADDWITAPLCYLFEKKADAQKWVSDGGPGDQLVEVLKIAGQTAKLKESTSKWTIWHSQVLNIGINVCNISDFGISAPTIPEETYSSLIEAFDTVLDARLLKNHNTLRKDLTKNNNGFKEFFLCGARLGGRNPTTDLVVEGISEATDIVADYSSIGPEGAPNTEPSQLSNDPSSQYSLVQETLARNAKFESEPRSLNMLLGFFGGIEEWLPETEGHVKAWFDLDPTHLTISIGPVKAITRNDGARIWFAQASREAFSITDYNNRSKESSQFQPLATTFWRDAWSGAKKMMRTVWGFIPAHHGVRVAQCEFTVDYLEWVSSGGEKLPANGAAPTVTLRVTDVFDLWVPRSRKRFGFFVYNLLFKLDSEWEKVMEHGIGGKWWMK